MSTTRPQTKPETRPPNTRLTVRNAPRTFSPHNTNQCPQMFADKWGVEPDAS